MTTLMKASNEWSKRTADEKFSTVPALHDACDYNKRISAQAKVLMRQLKVEQFENTLYLKGPDGGNATMNHWSFGQLCSRLGAPASYMRELPAPLAVENLMHGIKTFDGEQETHLLVSRNGGYKLRALVSPKYTRIWNSDVTSRLLRLTKQNPEWQPAPAAFDGSRGLYASDHDMFAFLVDNDRRIFETKNGGLSRGFFVWNSEVGAASFGICKFFYEYVCGNHRVWGAKNVTEFRIRHVGNADDRAFAQLTGELRNYANASASEDEGRIESAMKFKLGKNKDEVLDKLFGLKIPELTHKVITDGYERAVDHSDWYGDPKTLWGVVGGITEVARDIPFTDERVKVERGTGKLMEIKF
jgi:hypothetical protein